MTIKLTFLGTAGSIISSSRGFPAFLINDDLLLDCGEGTTQKLIQIDSIDTIRTICLTHLHLDHFIGIFSLLWHYGILERRKPLEIIGPSGINETIDKILDLVYTPNKLKTFEISFKELNDSNKIQLLDGKYNISSIKVEHSIISFAFRIEYEDRSICYSGDTRPTQNLIDLAKDCNLLICESTLPNEYAQLAHKINHSTPSDAAKIATKANCEKLALFHISSYFKDQITNFKKEAEVIFKKEVIIAEDLMVIDV